MNQVSAQESLTVRNDDDGDDGSMFLLGSTDELVSRSLLGSFAMFLFKLIARLLPEKREAVSGILTSSSVRGEHGVRIVRRGRRTGWLFKPRFCHWVILLAILLSLSLVAFALIFLQHGNVEIHVSFSGEVRQPFSVSDSSQPLPPPPAPKSKHRKQHFPCEIKFSESVNVFLEPEDYMNSTRFSLEYVEEEEKPLGTNLFEPRFGGHQTLEEREQSFLARSQTIHCGFVKAPSGLSSTGFELSEQDMAYMKPCQVAVSSCIFGSSDFLRRPTSRKISEFSKKTVCFVMFVDEQTLSKLSSEGHVPDTGGYIGLWKVVVVKNLPYKDMRKSGKVPKFLSHRLFPSARYSIWVDSKMRLDNDPMQIIEFFLWRMKAEYAISNHYDRHCVWEEVLQNKHLNKYNHTAIDEQFLFYQSDGLTKFNRSDPNTPLPSYVPEGSFIIRAHTPMSNLFSCLWFNEVDRFTPRDQLSFAYTYFKLMRTNPDKPFHINMFKDCQRRTLAKLFRHRAELYPPSHP